ncbi:hypothetical protein ACFL6C_12140, partial [Myxococcota bacterium]
FNLRYHYVAGNVPADGPCESCTDCVVNGAACSTGCSWWGCWQWDQLPPGRFVADFVEETIAAGAVPMITYYIWFSVAGNIEGAAEVARLNEPDRLSAWLSDFEFLCRVMAENPSPAILHIEPDLWGYGHQVNADPEQIPVALSEAAVPECSGLPSTLSGLARCLLAIARATAPNLLIAFHASGWGTGMDALNNSNPEFDMGGHARETAAFFRALGADQADLIASDMSDRDAGFNGRWWDETNATLPHFIQANGWVKALVDDLRLPHLWWMVPYGHMGLDDQCDRYRDNRVDYFFDHPEEFAATGSLGIAFGPGATCMTTAESDGGNFRDRAADYYGGEQSLLCGSR